MTANPKAKATARAGKRSSRKISLSAQDRYLRIQEEAYCLAEEDGFRQDPAEYWLAAEAEVDTS
jgi:hypothetical protein